MSELSLYYFYHRTDIVPVQIEDVREKQKEGGVIPGRVVRRAKRQASNQASHEGAVCLTNSNP